MRFYVCLVRQWFWLALCRYINHDYLYTSSESNLSRRDHSELGRGAAIMNGPDSTWGAATPTAVWRQELGGGIVGAISVALLDTWRNLGILRACYAASNQPSPTMNRRPRVNNDRLLTLWPPFVTIGIFLESAPPRPTPQDRGPGHEARVEVSGEA